MLYCHSQSESWTARVEEGMTVATAKISPRNQVALPRGVRKALGLHAGDTVLFIVEGDQVRLVRRPWMRIKQRNR